MKHGRLSDVGVLARLLRELALPASYLSPILAHAEAVRRDGDRLGLVSAADLDHVLARHSADSLLFAVGRAPRPGESWVDIGTGAGFPGLVLAICYPGTAFTLVEPQKRRAAFLEIVSSELGLSNARVVAERIERFDGRFDAATARALADPATAIEMCIGAVAAGGLVLVAAGRAAEGVPATRRLDVARPGVDSPGLLLMMTRPRKGSEGGSTAQGGDR